MRMKMLAGALVVGGVLAMSGVVGVAPAGATTTQGYSCSAIDGVKPAVNATVTAKATIDKTTKVISLTGVVFKLRNTFGVTATIDDIRFYVNDPNSTSAPYVAGSAAAAGVPAGWAAGHDSSGLYVVYAGSQTFKSLATLTTAALSAGYSDLGPAKTAIKFTVGTITFDVTAPVQAPVTCTPKTPEKVITQVTE
ncbi:MAG TPA: hypothetical protein VEI83_08365 [Acidimicrobiales bacterium]|nr:hypothetical protein [Acidimicrobiales bacterium]